MRLVPHAVRAFVLLVLLVAAAPLRADGTVLTRCLDELGGSTVAMGECYGRYIASLKDEQAQLLARIRTALQRTGPEGSDYPAAALALERGQTHWLAYTEADCEVVGDVFGSGTALGLAGGSCEFAHYEERNRVLKLLLEGYLDAYQE